VPTPAPAPPFRHIRIAFAVLVVDAALVALTDPNVVRSAFSAAALVATGYCALDLFVGKASRLRFSEVLAFSVGLGILAVGASALILWAFGVPLTEATILLLGLPLGLLAMLGTPPVPRRRALQVLASLDDLPGYSRAEKTAARVLFAGIVAALVLLVGMALVEVPGDLSPGLAILGPDGTANTLPTDFAVNYSRIVVVTVLGGEKAANYALRVRLVPANATGGEPFHEVLWDPLQLDAFAQARTNVSVGARTTRQVPIPVTIASAGDFALLFELLDPMTPLLSVRLPVRAS
jgi:uncharacterized membrane protein